MCADVVAAGSSQAALAALDAFMVQCRQGGGACLAVSGCLLGSPCRYDGRSKPHEPVRRLVQVVRSMGGRVQRICPEAAGGLRRPRPAAELQDEGRVLDVCGADVTAAFCRGAHATVELVRRRGASLAVLKAKSPSCGLHGVYDGTFSGVLRPGRGVAARALLDAGVAAVDEGDVERYLAGLADAGLTLSVLGFS